MLACHVGSDTLTAYVLYISRFITSRREMAELTWAVSWGMDSPKGRSAMVRLLARDVEFLHSSLDN